MPTISGWSTGEPVASADINSFLLRGNRNAIINGDMRVNQRQVSSVSDDAFCLDRWNILSDGATISVAQSTQAPSDGKYSLSMQSGTNGKKFGCVQYIENLNCVGMFGQTVTLSFKAKVSNATNLPNIKAAILSWSSTADTLTSDFVSAWNASGTTPTLIANWTFENTPSNLGVTTSWATYRVQGVIDTASAANVAVFIWSDGTANTTSDVLYVTDVQCEIGTIATPFERRSMADELVRCQRYYEKSYAIDTAPATNTVTGAHFLSGASDNFGNLSGMLRFTVVMRTNPTFTFYNTAGSSSAWDWNRAGTTGTATPVANYNTSQATFLTVGVVAGNIAGTYGYGHWIANAEL